MSEGSTTVGELGACLREAARIFRDVERDAHWTREFLELAALSATLADAPFEAAASERLSAAVQRLFSGMGGLRDQEHQPETDRVLSRLWSLSEDVARESWRRSGRPWHTVRTEELFEPGDVVTLLAGEAIQLHRDGTAVAAPVSAIRYAVRARLSPDVDNMPRYEVVAGTRLWVARHNALSRPPD